MTANDPFLAQISYSMLAIWIIQKMKGCNKLSWINENTDVINRVVAVLLSFVTAIGVQWTLQGGLLDGGTVTITFPSLTVMLEAALRWLQSFVLQQGMYKMYKATTGGK